MQPTQKNRQRGHNFNRFIPRRARGRVTENRDSSNGPFQGLLSAKRKVKEIYVTTALRPVVKNGANSTERQQKAENDSFAAYRS